MPVCFHEQKACPSVDREECDDSLHREELESGAVDLVCAIHISSSVRKIVIRDAYVRSVDHQVVRCCVSKINISAMYIHYDTALYVRKIVYDRTYVRMAGLHVVIVIEGSVRLAVCREVRIRVCAQCTGAVMQEIASTEVSVGSDITMDAAHIAVAEGMSEVVTEVSVNVASEIVAHITVCAAEVAVMSDIHIVAVTEIVVVSADIVTVEIAAGMRCGTDQQKDKLE